MIIIIIIIQIIMQLIITTTITITITIIMIIITIERKGGLLLLRGGRVLLRCRCLDSLDGELFV